MRWCLLIECHSERAENMDDATKWAQKKALEIRERRRQQDVNKQNFVAEEALKKAQTPHLWEQIGDAVREQTAQLVSAIGELDAVKMSMEGTDKLFVLTKTGAKASATFDRSALMIACFFGSTLVHYTPAVIEGQVLLAERGGGPKTPLEIAQMLLDAIAPHI
jgi:hypothetical protein